jgi:hypothetical protein
LALARFSRSAFSAFLRPASSFLAVGAATLVELTVGACLVGLGGGRLLGRLAELRDARPLDLRLLGQHVVPEQAARGALAFAPRPSMVS